VADDVIGTLTEFLGFQAGDGVVVDDAAEPLIREEDEVNVRGGMVEGGAGLRHAG
jgi:hypothetical protein